MIQPEDMADNLERLIGEWSDAHVAAMLEVLSRELFRRGCSGPGVLFAAAAELRHRAEGQLAVTGSSWPTRQTNEAFTSIRHGVR